MVCCGRSHVESQRNAGRSKIPANEGKKPLRLGLILGIGRDPNDAIAKVHDLDCRRAGIRGRNRFCPCGRLRQALDKYAIEATSLVVGGPGREVWISTRPADDWTSPRETRATRIAHIKKASDFAKQCGIAAVRRTADSFLRIRMICCTRKQ